MEYKTIFSEITQFDNSHSLYYSLVSKFESSLEYSTWDLEGGQLPVKLEWIFKADSGEKRFTFKSMSVYLILFLKGENPKNDLVELIYKSAEEMKLKLERDTKSIPLDKDTIETVADRLIQIAESEQLL